MKRILTGLCCFLAAVLAIGSVASAAAGGKGRSSSGVQMQTLAITSSGSPANEYLSIAVHPKGYFNSGATGAVTGRSFTLSYDWPTGFGTGFTTVQIDGSSHVIGRTGTILSGPVSLDAVTSEMVWESGSIQVTQRLQIVSSAATGRADTGMYMYTARNLGQAPHSVGLRLMIDTMLDRNDGAPFRVPGVGAVTTETDFYGSQVPQYWQAFHSLEDPDVMAQGTLAGGGATLPDRFTLANWYGIYLSQWDYSITPGRLVTEDSAVALWWHPVTLQPGESKTWVTFYGLGAISGAGALSVTGPAALTVEDGAWTPDPFTVTAYVTNDTALPLADVAVTLALPGGLTPAAGETAGKTIPQIAAGVTELVSWQVRPLTAGDHTYTVTALGLQQSRSVLVPAIGGPPETLCGMIRDHARNAGLANSLCSKLQAAEAAQARGQVKTAAQILAAFIQEVEAQRGKGLPADVAERLISGAQALMK